MQTSSVQLDELEAGHSVPGIDVSGAGIAAVLKVGVVVDKSATEEVREVGVITRGSIEVMLMRLELTVLGMVALLARLALTELVESEERTLSTELVAVKDPVVILGTVPARDIVGVVERPWALLKAVLTEDVLIAGATEDSELLHDGAVPATIW